MSSWYRVALASLIRAVPVPTYSFGNWFRRRRADPALPAGAMNESLACEAVEHREERLLAHAEGGAEDVARGGGGGGPAAGGGGGGGAAAGGGGGGPGRGGGRARGGKKSSGGPPPPRASS